MGSIFRDGQVELLWWSTAQPRQCTCCWPQSLLVLIRSWSRLSLIWSIQVFKKVEGWCITKPGVQALAPARKAREGQCLYFTGLARQQGQARCNINAPASQQVENVVHRPSSRHVKLSSCQSVLMQRPCVWLVKTCDRSWPYVWTTNLYKLEVPLSRANI